MPEKSLEEINDVDGLANYVAQKQIELQSAKDSREIIEIELFNLKLEILKLQREIKDKEITKNSLDQSLNKARAVCSRLDLLERRATQRFWRVKG
jgi:hypothetical protein